ncbi:hypothetical protein MPLA_1190001 [Mesorhizobium sp. ORS 3359]|nr:hypothetical protein MPLA_1190001 [Mesorhizobium sp. ORS 3359]
MAWYLNSYHCYECDQYWVEEWSCGCDSECPYCEARNVSALDSQDLERDEVISGRILHWRSSLSTRRVSCG